MAQLKIYQGKIILLLNRQELLIAELYRFFASLYPETREFWTDLYREELEHAEWVEYLYRKTQKDADRLRGLPGREAQELYGRNLREIS